MIRAIRRLLCALAGHPAPHAVCWRRYTMTLRCKRCGKEFEV